MNNITRDHYPVANLPADLRDGLPSDASVRVVVEEVRRPLTRDDLVASLEATRKHAPGITLEEAVARVRELRDEWDD